VLGMVIILVIALFTLKGIIETPVHAPPAVEASASP